MKIPLDAKNVRVSFYNYLDYVGPLFRDPIRKVDRNNGVQKEFEFTEPGAEVFAMPMKVLHEMESIIFTHRCLILYN
jgi:hypothetical protein